MKFLLFLFIITALPSPAAEQSYIVKFKDGSRSRKEREFPFLRKLDFNISGSAQSTRSASLAADYYILRSANAELIRGLAESPDIEYIEPNHIYRVEKTDINDPRSGEQWALEQVRAHKAWQYSTGENVIIGLIDTGLDYNHPDLKGQLWINNAEDLNGNGTFEPWSNEETRDGMKGDWDNRDNDGNGFIDDVAGFDFVDKEFRHLGDDRNPDPDPADEGRHGTNVAGVMIAAAGNGQGIVGLAYDAKLMAVRAFDVDGNAESDDIAAAIIYAATNGAKVINCSFGESYNSRIVSDAIKFAFEKGCVIVSSAGNEGTDFPHFPSDMLEVISVGGSSEKGLYGKSNHGRLVDLAAPAQDVLTTAVGGAYVRANGTSLAAPYVSAAAALLLSLNPDLTPDEVRTMIISGSDPFTGLSSQAPYVGAGTLNAENILRSPQLCDISIRNPEIDNIHSGKINADITVIHPALEKFEIYLSGGQGESQMIDESDRSEKNISPEIPTGSVATQGDYFLTAKVLLKSGRTIETSTRFRSSLKSPANKINSFEVLNGYFEDNSTAIAVVSTLLNSTVKITYAPGDDPASAKIIMNDYKIGRHHIINFTEGLEAGKEYIITVTAFAEKHDTVSASKKFIYESRSFPNNTFSQKDYTLPLSEMNNNASAELYANSDAVVLNRLNGLDFGYVYSYKFSDGKFITADSLADYTLPAGFADSDGDGKEEVLTTGNGAIGIYEAKEKNGNPFGNRQFSGSGIIYGALAAADIDSDGREEIPVYEDSVFYFLDYNMQTGNYDQILRTIFHKSFYRGSIVFRGKVGNFNGNTKPDIAFTNDFGHLAIYEIDGASASLLFYDSTAYGNTNHYMTSGDFDGNGTDEIVVGIHTVENILNSKGSGEQLWQYRMAAYENGAFRIVWKDYIYGVRTGIVGNIGQFKNGTSAGNADSDPADELVISAYPNLYVFDWEEETSRFRPLWNFPFTFSNSILIHDFDKNGIKEIGFGSFNESVFFEYNSEKSAPAGFKGRGINGNTVRLSWDAAPGATGYQVFRKRQDSDIGDLYLLTTATDVIIDTLTDNTEYSFFLIADYPGGKSSTNRELVTLFIHAPYEIVATEQRSGRSLVLHYNGSMPDNFIDPSNFRLSKEGKDFYPNTAITASDTMVIITFSDELATGEYVLHALSFPDYYNTMTAAAQLQIDVQNANPAEYMFITKGEIIGNGIVKVYFSDEIDAQSLELSKISIQPHGAIESYEVINGNEVILHLSGFSGNEATGKDFIIRFSDMSATDGKELTEGAGSSVSFSFTAADLSDVYIYPSPVKLSTESEAVFAGLTGNATVRIYTADGNLIKELTENNFNGGVEWDLTDSKGRKIEAGIYLFDVTGRDENDKSYISGLKKIAVIR